MLANIHQYGIVVNMPDDLTSTGGRRRYHSPRREEAAQRTRSRVLAAAERRFAVDGYTSTTLRAIAAEAGVSLASVVAVGRKPQLLIEAFALRMEAETAQIPVDPGDVEPAVAGFVELVAESLPLWRAMREGAASAPEVAALVEALGARQRRAMAATLRSFPHASDLSAAQRRRSVDELTWLLSHESFEHFVIHCRWSRARYRSWLGRRIAEVLPR